MMRQVLSENGFAIDSYENPTLALEKFKAHSYDLVVLDTKMSDLNGFASYREIKRLDKKVKVCFLTAGEMYYDEYPDIFSSLSVNRFIRKPIDNEELLNRVKEILVDDTTIQVLNRDDVLTILLIKCWRRSYYIELVLIATETLTPRSIKIYLPLSADRSGIRSLNHPRMT